jgi:metal-responsive CopG/Arc/MetJ family transcriptional regulator
MARQKSTYYLAEDIRIATKVAAVAGHRSESDVVEDALRGYLQTDEAERERESLRALMDRVAGRSNLSEEEAIRIANEELHAMRTERDRKR